MLSWLLDGLLSSAKSATTFLVETSFLPHLSLDVLGVKSLAIAPILLLLFLLLHSWRLTDGFINGNRPSCT